MKKIKTRLGFFREYWKKGKWRGQTVTFRYTVNKHEGHLVLYCRDFTSSIKSDWSALDWLTR